METACLEVETTDFEPENVLTQLRLVATACAAQKSLPLAGAKKKKNYNNNCKKIIEKSKTRGTTRGLPRRSPILVLLSPKQA